MAIKRDWEAAASLSDRLWSSVYELHVLALAADGFEGSPSGLEGLCDLATQVADAWHEYANKMLNDAVPDKDADEATP